MTTPALLLTNPLILKPILNAVSKQQGPHYQKDAAFFRNLKDAVTLDGTHYFPIDFDYAGKSFATNDGGSVRLTGKVFGQGSASTVFEGVLTDGSGIKHKVAVKIRDHALLSKTDGNKLAASETQHLKDLQKLDAGRVRYYGSTEIHGRTGIIVNQAQGVSYRSVNPRWVNAQTVQEIHTLFDTLEANHYRPGDFDLHIDQKGRVYLMDVEGINAGNPNPTTRAHILDTLNQSRSKAGLKALPPYKGGSGPMTPGITPKGFFVDSGINMALGFAGFGTTKLLEHLLDRKLSTTEQVGVYSGFFAPLITYSGGKAYLAARGTGSGILGSLGTAGKGLGKNLAGGIVAGLGAAFMLGDLGLKGDAHTVGTIALGSAAVAHPAGIAFFAGYSFGKFLNWGSKKFFGTSLSEGLADKIEDAVDGVKWLNRTLNPYERRRIRFEKEGEAWRERKFQEAVAKAKKFKAIENESIATQKKVEDVSNEDLKDQAQRTLEILKNANKTLKEFPSMEKIHQMLADGGVKNYRLELLDFDNQNRGIYLLKFRSPGKGWNPEKVNITWPEGREPALEVLRQGSASYSLLEY